MPGFKSAQDLPTEVLLDVINANNQGNSFGSGSRISGKGTTDLERIIYNPDATITITSSQGEIYVKAFLSRDISIGGANDFSGSGGEEGPLSKLINNFTNFAQYHSGYGTEGNAIPQVRVQHFLQSILSWTGSDLFTIEVPLLLVTIEEDGQQYPVRKAVLDLYQTVYPILSEGEALENIRQYAPMRYAPGAGVNRKTIPGGIRLQIGRWFQTPPILVARNVGFNFSKETVPETGQPLFAIGSMSLSSYCPVGIADIRRWFHESTPPELLSRI